MKVNVLDVINSTSDLSEKEIQHALENKLDAIDSGFQYIGSFVPVGTGTIDTLSIDSDENAVIMEFRRLGEFDVNALIQLMDYSWFVSDENHKALLTDAIKKKKTGF